MKLTFLMPNTTYQIICFFLGLAMIYLGMTIEHNIGSTIQNGGMLLAWWATLSFLVYKICNKEVASSILMQLVGIAIMIIVAMVLAILGGQK